MTEEPKSGVIAPAENPSGSPSPSHGYLKPRDAASLILLDRAGDEIRVLMGKRAKKHAFMPSVYVFPGGRRDPSDSRIAVAHPLHETVIEKLVKKSTQRMTATQCRGLGVAAIRETFEETGIALGSSVASGFDCPLPGFAGRGMAPDLSVLRFLARAITPPGQNRRFDTRFFCTFLDETGIEATDAKSTDELEDVQWVPLSRSGEFSSPKITTIILDDLKRELSLDANLPFGRPVPYYHVRYGRFAREIL